MLLVLVLTPCSQVFAGTQGLWVSEIRRVSNTDGAEFFNYSGDALDIAGWKFYFYDSQSWPSPRTSWTAPSGTVLDAFEVFAIFQEGAGSSSLPYRNYTLTSNLEWPEGSDAKFGVLVVDDANAIVDCFIGGGTSNLILGSDITSPMSIGAEWTGARFITTHGTPGLSFHRLDADDDNDRTDWDFGTATFGTVPHLYPDAPTVNVTREDASPTTATHVNFLVDFSQPVTGIQTGAISSSNDFAVVLAGGALSGFGIAQVTKVAADEYQVQVQTGTGSGELRLDVLRSGGIANPGGVALGSDHQGPSYVVDHVVPTIENITVAPSPAGLGDEVSIEIDFSEEMLSSVMPTVVLTTAANGAIAGSSTADGGDGSWTDADTYTVTLDRITVADDDGLAQLTISGAQDEVGQTIATDTSQTLLIDAVVPAITVTPLVTADATPPLSGSVTDNDSSAAIEILVDGQTVPATNHGDGTWTVADNVLATLAQGTYDVAARVTDVGGNEATDATTNELEIAPAFTGVTSVTQLDPVTTFLQSVRYVVTFSSTVLNLETGSTGPFNDFAVTPVSGGITGMFVESVLPVLPTSYLVTVNTGEGDGSFRLDVLKSGGLANAHGIPMSSDYISAPFYTVVRDILPPSIVSMTLANPPGPDIIYTIEFSEEVNGLELSPGISNDFALTVLSGAFPDRAITNIATSDNITYEVTVLPGTGSGRLRLDVLSTGGINDSRGQGLEGHYTSAPVYNFNTVAPFLTSVSISPSPAGVGRDVEIRLNFSEPMDTAIPPVVSVATQSNGSIAASPAGMGGDGTWIDGDTYEVTLNRSLVVADHGLARLHISNATDDDEQVMLPNSGRTFSIDGVVPALTVDPKTTEDLTPNITGTIVDNLPLAAIQVRIGTKTYPASNHGNGRWTLPGSLITPLPAGNYLVEANATDAAGNVGEATGMVTIDPAYLEVVDVLPLDASPTNKPTVRFRLRFSSMVSGLENLFTGSTNDFVTAESGGVHDSEVVGVSIVDPTTYVVEAAIGEGDGQLGLQVLNSGGIRNPNGYALATDVVLPVVYDINRLKVAGPSITTVDALPGDTLHLDVTATGGTPPYSYSWMLRPNAAGEGPIGVATPVLHISSLSFYDRGEYFCVVTDAYESRVSDATVVLVDAEVPASTPWGQLSLALLLAMAGAATLWRVSVRKN